MLITDQAFVLRNVKFKESSLISTLLTAENGKISTLSKGVFKTKNSRAHILEVGNKIDIELDINPQRNLQYLRNFQYSDSLTRYKNAPLRNALFAYMLELSNQLLPEDENQNASYILLDRFMGEIKIRPKNELHRLPLLFTYQLIGILGYPQNEWLQSRNLHEDELYDSDLPLRAEHLDNLLRFIHSHCQPLRTPISLGILRQLF